MAAAHLSRPSKVVFGECLWSPSHRCHFHPSLSPSLPTPSRQAESPSRVTKPSRKGKCNKYNKRGTPNDQLSPETLPESRALSPSNPSLPPVLSAPSYTQLLLTPSC